MYNETDYDMKEARERYNAIPPASLIKSNQPPAIGCGKRILYYPAEVLTLIENGYRGKVVAGEWMDGIALGLTTIPVFMVQPLGGEVSSSSRDAWEVAKAWMDMANSQLIARICDCIVERKCEISYEF